MGFRLSSWSPAPARVFCPTLIFPTLYLSFFLTSYIRVQASGSDTETTALQTAYPVFIVLFLAFSPGLVERWLTETDILQDIGKQYLRVVMLSI